MLSGRCLEEETLFYFRGGEELGRGVGWGFFVSDRRESPMKVWLVSCFGFFALFFVLVFEADLEWEQITRS